MLNGPITSPPQRPRPVRSQGGAGGLTNGEGSQNRDLCGPRSRRKFGDRCSKFLKTQNNATIVPHTVIDRSWQCRLRPSWPTPQNDAFCASRRYCLEMCEASEVRKGSFSGSRASRGMRPACHTRALALMHQLAASVRSIRFRSVESAGARRCVRAQSVFLLI